MATVSVPEDGQVRLGQVSLPPGRRIVPDGRQVMPDDGTPVAWVTRHVVAGPGRVWSALQDLHWQTGLTPVLLDPEDNLADFFFTGDVDPAALDGVPAAEVLADTWPAHDDNAGTAPGKESDLAPAEDLRLAATTLATALDSLEPAHIGLVPAARPADIPATVGWVAFNDLADWPNGIWLGSVLRSFEDRFGARLLKIGPGARMRLLVERPPRTVKAARQITAEHKAFADEQAQLGQLPVSRLATALVDAPIWSFWWD